MEQIALLARLTNGYFPRLSYDEMPQNQKWYYFALLCSKPMETLHESAIRSICTKIRAGEYGNSNYKSLEVFKRIVTLLLDVLAIPITVPLSGAGSFIEIVEDYRNPKSYCVMDGNGAEKKWSSDGITVMTLNSCMFYGGFPLIFGGVTPVNEKRIKTLANLINFNNPDIVCMQEMSFAPSLGLCKELIDEFSIFFYRIAKNPWKMKSCLFVASKYRVVSEPQFVAFECDKGMQSGMERGFFYFETEKFNIINTHQTPGDSDEDIIIRKKELQIITNKIEELKETNKKPCILVGDLNIHRTGKKRDEYSRSGISESYYDPYFGQSPKLDEQTATCSNYLTPYATGSSLTGDRFEIDDYTLIYKKEQELFDEIDISINLIKDTYSEDDPSKSISDHRALILKIKPIQNQKGL